jgi:serine protease Do
MRIRPKKEIDEMMNKKFDKQRAIEVRHYLWFIPLVVVLFVGLAGCSTADAASPTATTETMPVDAVSTGTPPVSMQASAPDLLAAYEGTLEDIYTTVNPSVVYIQVSVPVDQSVVFPFQLQPQTPQYQQASGSGFVWDQQGHIVTNNHVVENANTIEVTFADGTIAPAEVVGADPDSDLAVVKVDVPAAELKPIAVTDSTKVKVGQLAIAIGDPFALEGTMTAGIVSAKGRSLPASADATQTASYTIPDIIQTDAPINPGNSGGALVDDQGRLIGVTAAIESPSGANSGIGFAIPSAIVQKVIPVLIETGHYEHPRLGISGTDLTPTLAEAMGLASDQRGALVIDVNPGGPADSAGLQGSDRTVQINGQQMRVGGDVIVAIDGQPVQKFDDLVVYLARNTEVGQSVTLTILREGQEQQVPLTLEARSSPAAQRGSAESGTGNAWLGIVGVAITPDLAQEIGLPSDQQGILVEQADQNSPADAAGLRGSYKPVTINGQPFSVGGDVITAMDGQPITQIEDLQALLQGAEPGQESTLTILRDGEEMQVTVTLGTLPSSGQ